MDKVFEALEKVGGALGTLSVDDNGMPKIIIEGERGKNWLILKSAIERLEAIDNAKSEVLDCVDVLYANAIDLTTENTKYLPEYLKPIRDKIKQALLQAQDLEKENAELLQAIAIFKKKLEDTDNIKVAMTMAKQLDTNLTLGKELEKYKKAWEIIKKKGVDIDELKYCTNVYDYNQGSCTGARRLNQDEFKFLKEMVANA